MHVKRLLSLLLTALLAVTVLAGCAGRSDFSKEAADALNNAQTIVHFSTDSQLTKALKDSLKDNVQPDDVRSAMAADKNLQALLTDGCQLDVFAVRANTVKDAAESIAQNIASIASGKKSEGKAAMVLADNGYYYAAVLTCRDSNSSVSDDGSEDPAPDPGYIQTAPNSYTITTNEGFAALVDEKLQTSELESTNIKLECNVALPTNWPYSMTYSGTFDGQNHIVSGIECTGGSNYSGMFGTLTGTVKNCRFAGVSVSGGNFTGAVAGYNNGGNIKNCSVLSGHVSGAMGTGGITGVNAGTISNCDVAAAVSSTDWGIGGIAGQNSSGSSITDCHVSGNISSHSDTLGGIVGINFGTISSSHTTGTITGTKVVGGIVGQNDSFVEACYATGSINGTNTVGGLVANNSGTLKACYSSATVTCSGTGYLGGIVANNNGGNVVTCYSTGAVTGTTPSDEYIGGVSGLNTGTITACYTTSSIGTQSPSTTGALVGWNNNGSIHTCYWGNSLDDPCGIDTGSSTETSEIGTSLTWEQATEKMNSESGSGIQFVYHNDGQAPTLPI